MQPFVFLGVVLATCFLAYLVVEAAVAQNRLNTRIRHTLSFSAKGKVADRHFRAFLSFGRFLSTGEERERLTTRLRQAGFFRDEAIDSFLFGRIALLAAFWLLSILLIAPEDLAALATPSALFKQMVAALLASRLSEWWLNDRIKTHTKRIRHRIPETLELLAICVGSGLTFERSLQVVADELRPVAPDLAAEFERLCSELEISEDRQTVLARFARQSNVEELQMLAQTLLQSMRYGTPLVDALRTIATQSRLMQLDGIRERAGAVPARMSIPLILLILFPVIALLGAPAIVNLLRTMQGMTA